MGSWSESCGFSGLEIGEGDVAYICLISDKVRGSLNDGAFRHFAPVTTLIRGTYNDYGYLCIADDQAILDLFNQQTGLELQRGDDFSLAHLDGRDENRWWMHGRAFDFMGSIKPDFPYARDPEAEGYKSIPINSIAESFDLHATALRKYVEKCRTNLAEVKATENPDLNALLMRSAMDAMGLSDVIGYGQRPGLNREAFQEAIKSGADIEPYIESYRRPWILGWALGELRRNLSQNESAGPQHGGHEALLQFAHFLVDACESELDRRDD